MRTHTVVLTLLIVTVALSGCKSDSPATPSPPEKGSASAPAGKESPKAPEAKQEEAKKAEAPAAKKAEAPTEPTTQPTTASADGGVMPSEAAIDVRVKAATERLQGSEAGKLVLKSLNFHGGLKAWYSNGPIAFRFDYRPLNNPDRGPTDTHQVIDTWSSRARHVWTADKEAEFGWTGEKAWVKDPNESVKTNPRFWSLTPYYFVAVPFVMADPGVVLTMAGEQVFEEKTWTLVKATFKPGTGDAPDDFYVLYIDKESGRVGGLRYIVTYKGFFKTGGHSPEKFMSYDGAQTVKGITLPKTYRTFKWDPDKKEVGEQVTAITLSDVSFKPETKASYFEPVEGAKVLDGF